jgi:type III secretion system FlhB-like substrate exporter
MGAYHRYMRQQYDASAPSVGLGEDYGMIATSIAERTRRIDVLVQIDKALATAANRYDLAAEIVRHGWPHSSPRGRAD